MSALDEAITPCRVPQEYDITADYWFADAAEDRERPPEPGAKTWEQRRRAAKQACWDCPVKARLECLQGAVDRREKFGVWGGYYPEELKNFKPRED